MTTKISIDTDNIQLDQFLKWAGVLASGGEIETAKRRRLAPGDIIEIEGLGSYEVTRD
ncbi:RNA-binding S4 domain-containing protein [Selenomonas bovis]|uniref:RNA-binding S4 domain-containing protein n=1 Tax=Selenomonas bovis TaxID=416586 RepID=UPI003CFDE353